MGTAIEKLSSYLNLYKELNSLSVEDKKRIFEMYEYKYNDEMRDQRIVSANSHVYDILDDKAFAIWAGIESLQIARMSSATMEAIKILSSSGNHNADLVYSAASKIQTVKTFTTDLSSYSDSESEIFADESSNGWFDDTNDVFVDTDEDDSTDDWNDDTDDWDDEEDSEEPTEAEVEVQQAEVDDVEHVDESEVDTMMIDAICGSIMNIYDAMYAPLFQIRPVGILTSDGIITVDVNGGLLQVKSGLIYSQPLFALIKSVAKGSIKEIDYHEEVSLNCLAADGGLNYNYCPNMHIRHVFGVYRGKDGNLKVERNWSKYRSKLNASIRNDIVTIMSSFKGNQIKASESIISLFTNCFVAQQFDIRKSCLISFKCTQIEKSCGNDLIGQMIYDRNPFGIDKASTDLVTNSGGEFGIQKILLVLDKAKFNGEIMFAYKAISEIIASGNTLSAKETVIGRGINGMNITYNFESEQNIISLIIAGSGSGKGVLTNAILAFMFADGYPIVYADYKPDMAAMLWNLERSTGAKILAFDALAGKSSNGTRPVRDFGLGKNKPRIEGVTEKLNVMPYIKIMELMDAVALARMTGFNGMAKDKKMFFVLDEAQQMNKSLCSLREQLDGYLKEHKPRKGEEVSKEFKYCKKLMRVIDSLNSGNSDFRNTTGRVGNVGAMILGQQADCTAWATAAIKRDPVGFLVGNCSMKLLGKGAVDGTKYSLGDAVPDGKDMLKNMGYFALVDNALATKATQDSIKVAKTYLVLNENDYRPGNPGSSTAGILKNITDESLKQMTINDMYQDGKPNELIGFEGLIRYIGSNTPGFDLNTNLSKGYVEIEKLLAGLGLMSKYSTVEEYLFDCSIESLFTYGELASAIRDNKTINECQTTDESDESEEAASELNEIASGSNFGTVMDDEDDLEFGYSSDDKSTNTHYEINEQGQMFKTANSEMSDYASEMQEMLNTAKEEAKRVRPEDVLREENLDNDDLFDEVFRENNSTDDYARPFIDNSEQPMFTKSPTGKFKFSSNGADSFIRLDKEKMVQSENSKNKTFERFKAKFFEGKTGTSYEFRKRWEFILDQILTNYKPVSTITRLTIAGDTIVVNNRIVDTSSVLGGEFDIRFEDIVNFKVLFKKIPMVKELVVDKMMFGVLASEFGSGDLDILKIFEESRTLNSLSIIPLGGGSPMVIERNASMKRLNELRSQAEHERKLQQIDATAASYDPRLRERTPGQKNRASQTFINLGESSSKTAQARMEQQDPKWFSAVGYGLGANTLFLIGGALSLPSMAIGGVKKIFRMF